MSLVFLLSYVTLDISCEKLSRLCLIIGLLIQYLNKQIEANVDFELCSKIKKNGKIIVHGYNFDIID